MTATTEQLARLRRMVNEPAGSSAYSDETLRSMIEAHPLIDAAGEVQVLSDGSLNTAWAPTYDLNAAAADVWEEKAAALAGNFDFSADGQKFDRSQAYSQAMQQARYFRSRRAMGTFSMRPEPRRAVTDADD